MNSQPGILNRNINPSFLQPSEVTDKLVLGLSFSGINLIIYIVCILLSWYKMHYLLYFYFFNSYSELISIKQRAFFHSKVLSLSFFFCHLFIKYLYSNKYQPRQVNWATFPVDVYRWISIEKAIRTFCHPFCGILLEYLSVFFKNTIVHILTLSFSISHFQLFQIRPLRGLPWRFSG